MKTALIAVSLFLLSLNGFALTVCHGNVLDVNTLFVIEENPVSLLIKMEGDPMISISDADAIKLFNDSKLAYIFNTKTPKDLIFTYKLDFMKGLITIGKTNDEKIKTIKDVNLTTLTDINQIELEIFEINQLTCRKI